MEKLKPQLTRFKKLRPPYESSQEDGLKWIAEAHMRAQKCVDPQIDEVDFKKKMERLIEKVCCKKEKIAKRGHVLNDFLHLNWDEMHIFNLNMKNQGKGFGVRTQCFGSITENIFERFYHDHPPQPNDIIHVTCTGYLSPSAPQKLVASRGWFKDTTVTHAYHMGCMAAIPAIRMGIGFCNHSSNLCDIVHTEICSLYFNPFLHEAEQLVSQSLFADGFIKYSITRNTNEEPYLKIMGVREEMIPETSDLMKWECEDWGFKMTLSKEIPGAISQFLPAFFENLCLQAGFEAKKILKNAYFAIHPGGPKILEQIQTKLQLSEEQTLASRQILYEHGNMSSATLPHILEKILSESMYPSGSLVVGIAIGPGLTMGGILLEKVAF